MVKLLKKSINSKKGETDLKPLIYLLGAAAVLIILAVMISKIMSPIN